MPKTIDRQQLLDTLPASGLVYVPGASGAPADFMDALLSDPDRSRGLRMLTTYVPGINALNIDGLHPSASVTGLFMQPSLSAAQRAGRYRALPMSYAGFVRHLRDDIEIELAVVQVAPPDANGRCSLGPAVEFMPTVLGKRPRLLGLINHRTPVVAGAPSIAVEDFDHLCEVDTELPTYETEVDATTLAIARHVAPLIADGDALQTGLGKVPISLSRLLCERRGLRLHSGMLGDGLMDLHAAGALDPDFRHTTCVLVGSRQLYDWAAANDIVRVAGCGHTHHPRSFLDLPRFVSVNSALQVDLFGQCNLEHADGQAISTAGGAPDFARGARMSPGGRSIVALNATHHRGQGSRIVPCLPAGAMTTLSRIDVDHIVTEFGAARLAGRSVHERAQAIVSVAAPQFRETLLATWHEIAQRL